MSLLEFIKAATSCGVEGVDLLDRHFASTEPGYLRQLWEAAERAGVAIACVAISNKFGFPDEAERERSLEHIRTFTRIAKELGAKCGRIFTGENKKPGADYDAQKLWVLEAMKQCAEIAEEMDLPLGIENHDSVCRTAEEILWLMDEINSPFLGTVIDFLNFAPPSDPNSDREAIYAGVELLAPFALHVHAKIVGFDERGEDVYLDYARLLRLLYESEYDGFLSIEQRTDEPQKNLPSAVALLKRHISALSVQTR